MVPEMLEVFGFGWNVWKPVNPDPEYLEPGKLALAYPWSEYLVIEKMCCPQTTLVRPEGSRRVFESYLEHLVGRSCLPHLLSRRQLLVAKHKVANGLHVPLELHHSRHDEALQLLDS